MLKVPDISAEGEPRLRPQFLQTHVLYKECTCGLINVYKKCLQVHISIKFTDNVNCR